MKGSFSPQIQFIQEKNPELAGYLILAKRFLSSDPYAALTKCRIVLEKILSHIYISEKGKIPNKGLIGQMLVDKDIVAKIPRRILARMNLIREMGNLGAHGGEKVKKEDVTLVFGEILYVTEWYLSHYNYYESRISENARSLEILPQLKTKYKEKIRREITSVKFRQDDERCQLEITTPRIVAGYLKDEIIQRTDLGFIADDDLDDLFFDPRKNIEENANRFVNEFDEYSVDMCTELFFHE